MVLGFNKTIYEITVNGDINDCSISAYNRRFESIEVSIDDLFDPEQELLGLCLLRDWPNVKILRSIPSFEEPSKVIERYSLWREEHCDQESWSRDVLEQCRVYLKETYGEFWINRYQKEPYYRMDDGWYLAVSYIGGLRGIVIETAENEDEARRGVFEDSGIIYEGFDPVDSLRLLKDFINECWDEFRREVGQRVR